MTNDEFRTIVKEMRWAQQNALNSESSRERYVFEVESHHLERAVDKALSEHDGGQSRLFGDEK